MIRSYTILRSMLLFATTVSAQRTDDNRGFDSDPATDEIYAVKPLLEGGLSLAGIAATTYMFQKINDKGGFDATGLQRSDSPVSTAVEPQAVNGLIYAASPLGPNSTDRQRPQAYFTDLGDDTRGEEGNLNSFFSGHVSTTATGTFFFAKVLSDYNPQWTGRPSPPTWSSATVSAPWSAF